MEFEPSDAPRDLPVYPPTPPFASYPPLPTPSNPPAPPYASYPPYATPPAPRRKPRSLIAIAVASIAVLVAGVFAAVSLTGGGGASSPEGAVERFMSALDKEDAIGMLSAMTPAERDVLRPTLTGLNDQLARLGIIKKVDLSSVPGFDIEVHDLKLDHTDVLPGISRVNLRGGTIKASTQPDEVPIGEVLRGLIEATGGDATVPQTSDESTLGGNDDEFLVAVDNGDGWYLSLGFTIAEQARNSSAKPVPDPAAAVKPRGASSPDAAVRQFLDDIAALKLEHMIGDLAPDEMAPLDLYAPLFLSDAQAELDDSVGNRFSLDIRDLQTATEDVDGGVRVTVTSFSGSVSFDGGTIDIDSSDGCVTMNVSGSDLGLSDSPFALNGKKICPGDNLGSLGSSSANDAFARLSQAASQAKIGFIVVQRGGAYFISPLRTVSDALLQILGVFERSDFEKGGAIYELFTDGFGRTQKFESVANSIGPSTSVTPSTIPRANSHVPPPTDPPPTDSKTLEALALACWADPRAGCDDLGKAADNEHNAEMAQYARTCGGRIPDPGSNPPLTCAEIFG